MFPLDILITYTAACILLVLAPGPDNLLAVGRGLSQGRLAACISGLSSGMGILFHVAAATFGLTMLMQTSALAFIPQFVSPLRGSVTVQMLVYGVWFALLTALGFALMGMFASRLTRWLRERPRVVAGFNISAGLTFIASGLSVSVLQQK